MNNMYGYPTSNGLERTSPHDGYLNPRNNFTPPTTRFSDIQPIDDGLQLNRSLLFDGSQRLNTGLNLNDGLQLGGSQQYAGVQQFGSGQQFSGRGQHFSGGGQQFGGGSGGQQFSGGGQQFDDGQQFFSGGGQQFSGGGQQFSGGGQQFSGGGQQFSGGGQQFSGGGQQFSGGGQQFSGGGQQFSGQQFSSGGQQFSGGGQHFSGAGQQSSVGGQEFGHGGQQSHSSHGGQQNDSDVMNPAPQTSALLPPHFPASTIATGPRKRKRTNRSTVSAAVPESTPPVPTPSAPIVNTNAANSTTPATTVTQSQSINRFLADVNQQVEDREPEEEVDYSQKTADELQGISKDKSKKHMTNSDVEVFLEFYLTQQKDLALLAIERRVSVEMVEKLLGRKQSLRAATIWNNFMKTPIARAIFKESGKGVKDKEAMGKLSAMWDAMTLDEKRAFATDPTVGPDQDAASESNPTGAAVVDTTTTGNNPQETTTTDLVPTPQVPTVGGLRVCSKSLKAAHSRVDKWMTEWQAKAVHVAKSSHCEFVLIGISNHLSAHNFQFTRSTPGAAPFSKQIEHADGLQSYQNRLQAFLSGFRINNIPALVNKAKIPLAREAATNLRTRLGSFVAEETNGLKQSWSWGDCDSQLGAIGFKLVFLPGAKSNPIWLKTLSRELKGPMITLINHDLDQNLIRVVADQDALLGVVPRCKKNLPKKQPPRTTDDTNSELGAPTTSANSTTNQSKRKRLTTSGSRHRARTPLTAAEKALDDSDDEGEDE
ncbi:hypothetical protein PtB15_17B25 [Puccinia triticina]|nr:hypothetical protein PtB15_17B25 [Puccinia triticina]